MLSWIEHKKSFITSGPDQGSANFEIWIGPADDDDVISEHISKKKKNMYISPVRKTNVVQAQCIHTCHTNGLIIRLPLLMIRVNCLFTAQSSVKCWFFDSVWIMT